MGKVSGNRPLSPTVRMSKPYIMAKSPQLQQCKPMEKVGAFTNELELTGIGK